VLALGVILAIPVGMFLMARAGTRAVAEKVREIQADYTNLRTAGMTDEERQAYLKRPPFLLRHFAIVGIVGLIALCAMVPQLSPGALAVFIAMTVKRSWRAHQETHETPDEDSTVSSDGPVTLGLSGAGQKRDRGPADR